MWSRPSSCSSSSQTVRCPGLAWAGWLAGVLCGGRQVLGVVRDHRHCAGAQSVGTACDLLLVPFHRRASPPLVVGLNLLPPPKKHCSNGGRADGDERRQGDRGTARLRGRCVHRAAGWAMDRHACQRAGARRRGGGGGGGQSPRRHPRLRPALHQRPRRSGTKLVVGSRGILVCGCEWVGGLGGAGGPGPGERPVVFCRAGPWHGPASLA